MLRLSLLVLTVVLMISRGSFAFLARPNARTSLLVRNFWPFDKAEAPTGIAIIDAIQTQKEESVSFVIARAGSTLSTVVNEKDPSSGNNAMHIIAKKGHYKFPPAAIPKKLVDSGIDVNAKNGKGETALEISLLSGWQKIAILLLDNGADKSVVTSSIKSKITCPDCKRVVKEYSL